MKKLAFTLLACLAIQIPAHSQETAEQLVATMRKADMTYKELMGSMGRSLETMQHGVLTMNREMVEQGAYFIFNHPAPNHAPWAIFQPSDQAGFKSALVTYDKVLDEHTKDIVKSANLRDWLKASEHLSALQGACVSCHVQWQQKAMRWPPLRN